ncbi:MAG: hypothetical protein QNJ06_18535 [Kiloniellales bacterium]|nr:hypothetical protein [Kiloniellales bacterium]
MPKAAVALASLLLVALVAPIGSTEALGYDLHLERLAENEVVPVPLEEWLAALEAVEGVRPAENDVVAKNPNTGEVIRFPRAPGDAEIYFPEEGEWWNVIHFFEGRGRLRHPANTSAGQDEVWRVIAQLCARLDLIARGDEGERYDPESGELIRE